MAFTPAGMFYLSAEDVAPTMNLAGKGIRGMLGLQNKEEAVNTILEGADYSTPEGRQAALSRVKAIDPTKWEELNKQNQEYELTLLSKKAYAQQVELQNKSLQIKQDEIAAQKRVPKLGNWWDINEKQGAVQYFLQTTQDAEHLTDIDWATMNETKAKALLRKIHKGGAGQQIKSMQEELTKKRNTHIVNNKYNEEAATSTEVYQEAGSLFGASNLPPLGSTPMPPIVAPVTPTPPGAPDTFNMGNPYTGSTPTIPYEEDSSYTAARGPNKGKEQWTGYPDPAYKSKLRRGTR